MIGRYRRGPAAEASPRIMGDITLSPPAAAPGVIGFPGRAALISDGLRSMLRPVATPPLTHIKGPSDGLSYFLPPSRSSAC